ncbi:hypothetical protein RF55_17240 [Lasius niger]|uniref:Uncharacterized protein n=1 Tax=Lasius niger TaxID=67767 RepID=A0A0J7K2R4_LASNI|nr:hypothetical protein RF55_17240 [Lasius niger]
MGEVLHGNALWEREVPIPQMIRAIRATPRRRWDRYALSLHACHTRSNMGYSAGADNLSIYGRWRDNSNRLWPFVWAPPTKTVGDGWTFLLAPFRPFRLVGPGAGSVPLAYPWWCGGLGTVPVSPASFPVTGTG